MRSQLKSARCPGDARRTLIETNILWLNQALDLLDRIDEEAFVRTPLRLEPHRAGAHLRHILEFYDCFLDGLGIANGWLLSSTSRELQTL